MRVIKSMFVMVYSGGDILRRVKHSVRNMVCVLSVIFNIVPEIFFISIFLTLFNAALPYVNVVFLQIIIDEFIERADYKRLIACAASAILLNVIILLFISILKAVSAKRKVKFELQFGRMLGLHQMEFTLADIESNKVSELQRNIVQTKMRNGGMEMIIDKIEFIIKNVFSLLLAVFSFIHIFSLHETVEQKSFWTGPYPLIGLLVVIVFLSVVSFKAQAKQNEKVSDLNQKANQANGGAFMYMELISDYHFGKDMNQQQRWTPARKRRFMKILITMYLAEQSFIYRTGFRAAVFVIVFLYSIRDIWYRGERMSN